MAYNVWCLDDNRWTNYNQDPKHPKDMTLEEATKIFHRLNGNSVPDIFEVRKIRPDSNIEKDVEDTQTSLHAALKTTSPAVNDHVCPTCLETRVSKEEKVKGIPCWRCGNPL